jgi:thioredoxin 1
MQKSIEITKDNFEDEVIKSSIPVLLKCGAAWCARCRSLEMILGQIMPDFEEKIKFAKLDVDNEEALREKYEVLSVPTLILFKNGELVRQKTGTMSRQQIIDFLSDAASPMLAHS